MAANAELVRATASKTPEEARDALFTLLKEAPTEPWPRCLGHVHVPLGLADRTGKWIPATSETDETTCRALLFEYMPDLVPLTKSTVTPDVAAQFKAIQSRLHALKILHRDHLDHAAWPDVGFGNVFLRQNPSTGHQGLCSLLPFDGSGP